MKFFSCICPGCILNVKLQLASSGAQLSCSPLQEARMTVLLQEDELIQSENSASIFNTLSDIPSQIEDADVLLREAMRVAGSLTDVAVETQRRKHLAYLIAEQGQLLNSSTTVNNLSKVSAQSSTAYGAPFLPFLMYSHPIMVCEQEVLLFEKIFGSRIVSEKNVLGISIPMKCCQICPG